MITDAGDLHFGSRCDVTLSICDLMVTPAFAGIGV
jgi:hypothetical protein